MRALLKKYFGPTVKVLNSISDVVPDEPTSPQFIPGKSEEGEGEINFLGQQLLDVLHKLLFLPRFTV